MSKYFYIFFLLLNNKKMQKIPLVIENEYSDFNDFCQKEKHLICSKILESFEEMLNTDGLDKKLFVVATVGGITFDTEFHISKNNMDLLTKTVGDYFKNNEEYEYCDRIQKLHLKSIN